MQVCMYVHMYVYTYMYTIWVARPAVLHVSAISLPSQGLLADTKDNKQMALHLVFTEESNRREAASFH